MTFQFVHLIRFPLKKFQHNIRCVHNSKVQTFVVSENKSKHRRNDMVDEINTGANNIIFLYHIFLYSITLILRLENYTVS